MDGWIQLINGSMASGGWCNLVLPKNQKKIPIKLNEKTQGGTPDSDWDLLHWLNVIEKILALCRKMINNVCLKAGMYTVGKKEIRWCNRDLWDLGIL